MRISQLTLLLIFSTACELAKRLKTSSYLLRQQDWDELGEAEWAALIEQTDADIDFADSQVRAAREALLGDQELDWDTPAPFDLTAHKP